MEIAIKHFPGMKFKNKKVYGQRATYVVEIPEKQTLLDLYTFFKNKLTLNFGFCKCCPEDNYNKYIGRSLACARMTPLEFHFDGIRGEKGRHIFMFSIEDIDAWFSVYPKSNRVRCEYIGKAIR